MKNQIAFEKFQGLGNDFVILNVTSLEEIDSHFLKKIADRRRGVGCDQLLVLLPPDDDRVQARLFIFNGDGSSAGACGNGTRCLVRYLAKKNPGLTTISMSTPAGILRGSLCNDDEAIVEQGKPKFLTSEPLNISEFGLEAKGYPVDMGNNQLVIFTSEVNKDNLDEFGPKLERHPFFPDRTNVEFCSVSESGTIKVLVWERGAGKTEACGSGACAVAFVAIKKGFVNVESSVKVEMEGGALQISLDIDGFVSHRGEAKFVFSGTYIH